MSPQDALRILDQATDPRRAGQITRGDYANVQGALQALADFVNVVVKMADKAKAPEALPAPAAQDPVAAAPMEEKPAKRAKADKAK